MHTLPLLLNGAGVPDGIANLIQSVGFPIVAFLICAWYIYWKDKEQNKRIDKMQEDFNSKSEKMQEFCLTMQDKYVELISKMELTIDNNTDALEKLSAKIDKEVVKNED